MAKRRTKKALRHGSGQAAKYVCTVCRTPYRKMGNCCGQPVKAK